MTDLPYTDDESMSKPNPDTIHADLPGGITPCGLSAWEVPADTCLPNVTCVDCLVTLTASALGEDLTYVDPDPVHKYAAYVEYGPDTFAPTYGADDLRRAREEGVRSMREWAAERVYNDLPTEHDNVTALSRGGSMSDNQDLIARIKELELELNQEKAVVKLLRLQLKESEDRYRARFDDVMNVVKHW